MRRIARLISANRTENIYLISAKNNENSRFSSAKDVILKERRAMYIHQHRNWPHFTWENDELLAPLSEVRSILGRLYGRMESIGFKLRDEATLISLTTDVLKSSAIEGEHLNPEEVRSSIARRLGMDIAGLIPSKRDVDGVVEMMLDATQNYQDDLSDDRFFGWHSALFPSGRSGMHRITTGNYRTDEHGPMLVVSGPMGKESIHFEAPESSRVPQEMKQFIEWFNSTNTVEPVIKAAIAHVWFITIHPMDDGNGRMARAIADLQLARVDQSNQRFYSMSNEIEKDKKKYYAILELTQRGDLDITPWILWFLECLLKSLKQTDSSLKTIFQKAKFWEIHRETRLNERQSNMINRLQGEFHGKLNTSKYAKISKCSQDTAYRDILDLISKNVFQQEEAGGRSTHYTLVLPKV
jgi:Fic family protein